MKGLAGSLRARLVWHLVKLQLVALTVFVIVIVIPPADSRGERRLDDAVLQRIAGSLILEDGGLALQPDGALGALMAEHPGFWFYASNARGSTARHGPIPERVEQIFDRLETVTQLKLRWQGTEPELDLIAERMASPAGMVTIVSGGGPKILPIFDLFNTVRGYYVSLVLLLGAVTVAALPWIVRRALRGLSSVEAEARRIDIDQPGTRLNEADVPAELHALVRAFNGALARLDEGLDRRQRFLAAAAHELRTPIAILTTRIEMMAPGAERNRLLMDVSRLALLADQLLDRQRLLGEPLPAETVDLAEVAGDAIADIAPLAIGAECELSFEGPAVPVQIRADRQAIARVVTNLLHNAIVHGGPGTVIEVEVCWPAELRVRDNGPGVSAAERDRIFDPFYRAPGAGAGSGLGLNLVHDIVARYGGMVHVADAPGGGAEFIVRFRPVDAAGTN